MEPLPIEASRTSNRRQLIFCLISIVIAAFAAHGSILCFEYIWEDHNTFLDPSPLQSISNLPKLFFASAHQGFSVSHTTPYYRPATFLSWGLEYALFGPDPFWNHLVNLTMHSATAISLFLIGRRLLPAHLLPAIAAAMLFAVYPATMESVAYIAGRADILCGLTMGWSFWSYLRFRQEHQHPFLVLALFLLLTALLAKEMAVMLPVVILLYELGLARGKNLLLTIYPAAVTLAYLLVRANILTVQKWTNTPLAERLVTGVYVIGKYLLILFFPIDIKTFYDVTVKFSLLQSEVLVMLAVIVGYLILTFVFFIRRQRLLAALLLAVPVLIFPASNIPGMILPSPIAARYLYIPAMGFCLAAGLAFSLCYAALTRNTPLQQRSTMAYLSLLVICGILGTVTATTNGKWRNNDTFFSTMLREVPELPLAYKLAGNYLGKTGRGSEMARLNVQAYEATKQRQMALAKELINFGNFERAEFELRRVMNAEDDPRICQMLTSIQERQGKKP